MGASWRDLGRARLDNARSRPPGATGDEPFPAGNAPPVAKVDRQSIADRAALHWAALELEARRVDALHRVDPVRADLPGSHTPATRWNMIHTDRGAAGHGRPVDGTPEGDAEPGTPKADDHRRRIDPGVVDRTDLLTAVSRELWPAAGLEDLDASTGRPPGRRSGTGVRRVAGKSELDAIFAGQGPLD